MTYAGFWNRSVSFFVDTVVTSVIGAIAWGILEFLYCALTGAVENAGFVGQIGWILAGWIYYAALESSKTQGTLGKMALSIKVTDLDGNRISFGRATARHFAKILSGSVLLIGFFMAAFTPKKQALHDIIAGCLVVKK